MPGARYRIIVDGFRVNAETWDDALNRDGRLDEVFISTSFKLAGPDGNISYQNQPQTPTMGDTNEQPGRVLAGTGTRWGGLRANDTFPTQTPWVRTIDLSPERDYPPYVAAEFDLTAGERVAFFTPTIWEWDPGQNILEGWLNWHQQTDEKVRPARERRVRGHMAVSWPNFRCCVARHPDRRNSHRKRPAG